MQSWTDNYVRDVLRTDWRLEKTDVSSSILVHPITKESITKNKTLIEDLLLKDKWMKAMCVELGRLAQGYQDIPGTNTIKFMTHEEIQNIPMDRTVT